MLAMTKLVLLVAVFCFAGLSAPEDLNPEKEFRLSPLVLDNYVMGTRMEFLGKQFRIPDSSEIDFEVILMGTRKEPLFFLDLAGQKYLAHISSWNRAQAPNRQRIQLYFFERDAHRIHSALGSLDLKEGEVQELSKGYEPQQKGFFDYDWVAVQIVKRENASLHATLTLQVNRELFFDGDPLPAGFTAESSAPVAKRPPPIAKPSAPKSPAVPPKNGTGFDDL